MITLDLKHFEKIVNSGMSCHRTPELYLLYKKDSELLSKYLDIKYKNESDYNKKVLIEKWFNSHELSNLIKVTGEPAVYNYDVRVALRNIFSDITEDPSDWIDEWRELFPKGTNSSGYRWRGDKQGCSKKMKTFLRKHPKISKDTIFKATEKYIKENNKNPYMRLAHYFIEKDGISDLMSTIEGLDEDSVSVNRVRAL